MTSSGPGKTSLETYSSKWPFHPSDKLPACGVSTSKAIERKTPFCYRGYVYYYKSRKFVRRAVSSLSVLERIWAIGTVLYDRPDVLGMEESATARALARLVFDLRASEHVFPTKEVFQRCIGKDKIKKLRHQVAGLRRPPVGVDELLEELADLNEEL